MSSRMFRLYLGASELQIYSAPSGGQGTHLSHDLIVRIFTWLEKNENTRGVNRGGDGERTAPQNKRVFMVGTNTGAAGTGSAVVQPEQRNCPGISCSRHLHGFATVPPEMKVKLN